MSESVPPKGYKIKEKPQPKTALCICTYVPSIRYYPQYNGWYKVGIKHRAQVSRNLFKPI